MTSTVPAQVEQSDADLVVAFRDRGRNAAYVQLIRRYQIPLFRMLLAFMVHGDAAEELCEKVFVDAATDIGDLTTPADFYPWLSKRARDKAAEVLEHGLTQAVPSAELGPLAPADELRVAVESALAGLSQQERAVLVLSELEGRTSHKVAAVLDLPPSQVETLLGDARSRFLDKLGRARSSDERTAASLSEGTLVGGRYRLKSLLGQGGMGQVYLAEHEGRGIDVAVKVMQPVEGVVDDELRKRFRREAMVLGKLDHDNFVDILDFGEAPNGSLFLALELLEGSSLTEHIRRGLAAPEALHILAHVLRGLAFMHDEGIVHRDIKPENIIIVQRADDDHFAKILDLGIAKLVTTGAQPAPALTKLTQPNVVLGTPAYLSPEQAFDLEVDGRADLYAASVMLFEMITGELPFTAPTPAMMLAHHLSTPPPTLMATIPRFPHIDALQTLLDRGLAKQPDDRFDDARAFLAAVEQVAARLG